MDQHDPRMLNGRVQGKVRVEHVGPGRRGPVGLIEEAHDYKTMTPDELLGLAQEMGVRLLPCQMTMDLLGLKHQDLLEGLEPPVGAATALLEMKDASVQLFI